MEVDCEMNVCDMDSKVYRFTDHRVDFQTSIRSMNGYSLHHFLVYFECTDG